jgi:hypothetical protein
VQKPKKKAGMAKQIIVQRIEKGPGGDNNVGVVAWFAVAAGREIPIANAVSVWPGASVAENAAIAAGQVIEESYSAQYTLTTTKAQIQADLVAKFNARQAQITARPNPNLFFGVFFDSVTGWSA